MEIVIPKTSSGLLVGYVRAAASDPTAEDQVNQLIGVGVAPIVIFKDIVSTSQARFPSWQALWREVEEGDKVVVPAFSSLGRTIAEVVVTVDALIARGVGLMVLSESLDTNTLMGQAVTRCFVSLAQLARGTLDVPKEPGLQQDAQNSVGRPPKLTLPMLDAAIVRVNSGETIKQVAEDLKVHRNSLQRRMDVRRKQIRMEAAGDEP
jgi:DNA invertase Pin-like site-specific DNA recombinase